CDVIDKKCTTVIHVTHDMKDSWVLADKAAIMHQGGIIQFGAVRNLFERPVNKFVADFVGASFWEARVGSKINSTTNLKVGDFNILSKDSALEGESVKVAVRPEEIMLYNTPPDDLNGDNLFKTRVEKIKCEGDVWAVSVKVGETELNINSTRNMMSELYPKPGDTLYARINADHVRIVQ
ncbi:MAG: TOBE domain-containing protein, partial [Desulfobacteraceae bacterium]|nr:TOBE domain-containing protein [Desulfobacteraceae bacterium]